MEPLKYIYINIIPTNLGFDHDPLYGISWGVTAVTGGITPRHHLVVGPVEIQLVELTVPEDHHRVVPQENSSRLGIFLPQKIGLGG